MVFDEICKAHCAQILSCSSPRANAWLIARPIFPRF
jgi:hypothetical protein